MIITLFVLLLVVLYGCGFGYTFALAMREASGKHPDDDAAVALLCAVLFPMFLPALLVYRMVMGPRIPAAQARPMPPSSLDKPYAYGNGSGLKVVADPDPEPKP